MNNNCGPYDGEEHGECPIQPPLEQVYPGIERTRTDVVVTNGKIPDLGVAWLTADSRELESLALLHMQGSPEVVQRLEGYGVKGWGADDIQRIEGAKAKAMASFIDGIKP